VRLGVLVLVAGALALSACAKGEKDDGVDNGYCTQATIDAYSNVVSRGLWKSDGENSVTASCRKIQDLLGGRSCKAQKLSTGEESTISYATVQEVCEKTLPKSSNPYTPIPVPSSKYVGSNGHCTEAFKKDVAEVRRDLNKALATKNSTYAYTAKAKCVIMEYEFHELSCKSYDVKKQEFVSNSAKSGELGELCKGAQRLHERFKNNKQR
jgi:hypothetical protein